MWEAFIDGHSTGQLSVTAHALGTWLEPARVRKNIWLTVWGDTVQHGWGGNVADRRIRRWLIMWLCNQEAESGQEVRWTIKPQDSSLVTYFLQLSQQLCHLEPVLRYMSVYRTCFPSQHITKGFHNLWVALSLASTNGSVYFILCWLLHAAA